MRSIQQSIIVLALAVLVGCAQLGLATPKTFNDKAAVAYGSVTQVVKTTTTLLTAKKISSNDAQNVLTTAENAKAGIDVAVQIAATDPATATNKLTAINAALTAIIGYLATKGN